MTKSAPTLPLTESKPLCVTAFIAPQSLVESSFYSDNSENNAFILSVGIYMSDRSISRISCFTNAANALNYAFMLKSENCPISKNAFSLLQSEIKRTGAVSSRAKANTDDKIDKCKASDDKMPDDSKADTPLMKQYREMKKKHPDAVLLFRVGDFYECFAEDAVIASEVLGITLTRRANGKLKSIELAGFPHHALDTYLPKLVRAGKRVAICEQIEEPVKRKRVAKRTEN